jgi:AcrR family transcriptional regulator
VSRPAKIRPGEPGRARIEDAALELFGEKGYEGTSVSEISGRAGITKSVLYHHFDSKADLYEAVCARETSDLIAQVHRAIGADSEEPTFRRGIVVYLEFLAARPKAWRLLLRDRPAEPSVAGIHTRLEAERADALSLLLASPGKRATNPLHVSMVVVAIRAFASWWHDHPDVPLAEIADAIMAFSRAGLESVSPTGRRRLGSSVASRA